ncbi:malonyl-ACP O-methyltransferase BioC [Affinibrenneria salicis]|uniref:Malonyl-[acyl-carrier protein] O-methyltransferase n=1 Tax=Affinibrenneria salicis TaxID=2590031 RepID=A0A5J5G269_9GAMM|nr:malonyl-ACP O-methyltransferase BioC [Affinibrenneria salicis]KAA9000582.1 malonyl-ACP O-methyltransferase BioC [Affinibrenneria salicis]
MPTEPAPRQADKQAIARAFGRAAARYDRFAELQRISGERLMALSADHPGRQVLDAGCGTGYFSRRWRQQGREVTALDLSAEMLAQARQQQAATHYLSGDIEHLPLPDGAVDISFCNLAVQWCDTLPRALAELHRVTRPGGRVVFSTLAQGSLQELAQAWTALDGSRRVNRFLPAAAIEQACRPWRHQISAEQHCLWFSDVMTLMQSLKGIGATWLQQGRAPGLLGRRRLDALATGYPRREQGFPLSYHLIYGVLYHD